MANTTTELNKEDMTFMSTAIKYIINNYRSQGKYVQDKYVASGRSSVYYKEQLDTLDTKFKELQSALGNKSTASKKVIIKHLKARAEALSKTTSKKKGATDRALAVSTKIITLNKKLRRIVKESK